MELDYWGIESMQNEKINTLAAVFTKIHQNTASPPVLEMWNRAGPWDLVEALENGKMSLSQDLPIVRLQLTPEFFYIGQTPTLTGTFIGRLEDKDGIAEGIFMHNSDYPAGVSLNGYGRDFDADSYYEGYFQESKPQGYGKLVYRNGNVQDG